MNEMLQRDASKKKAAVKVRAASLSDYEQITALESRYRLPSRNYDDWRHLWLNNPVYRELEGDWPIGWVLENEDKQIVGSIGNIPSIYEFDGKRILVSSGANWVAEVAYRSASLQLLNNVIAQRYVDLYLNNTVNQNAWPAVTALGCSRVPAGVWDETAYWITNYRKFFQSVLGMKNYRLIKPLSYPPGGGSWTRPKVMRARLSTPLSYPLSVVAFLRDRLAKTALRESDVEVKACSGFDERFDAFWEDLRSNNPRVLLAVRTREILEWHFKSALLDNQLWIAAVVDGARLAACAIFKKVKPTRVSLVDYTSLDGSASLLAPLLSWALRKCRSEGIHELEYTGRWLEKGQVLDAAAPYRRKLPLWAYYYRANNPELKATLEDPKVWDPSLFDSEATLP